VQSVVEHSKVIWCKIHSI